jgi:RNA-directed DNA polymerase
MKTIPWRVYAPTRRKEHWKSRDINWDSVQSKVKRLQMRIAKAAKLRRFRLMRSLQWILAHSYYAKLLAVRRVTSNQGKSTPGVDGVVWRTSRQKMKAVEQLFRRGYSALPLRRVYIPKKSGKLRPLGIPTMRDRAMQALYALTLAPIAETNADPNSYGFREGRSCADAMMQCYLCLARKDSARWILEADIASCFDNINHQWLMKHVPIDRKMLAQWLKAGYLEKGELYPTLKGTPQGGIISPLLMNMTLDGLERTAKRAAPWYVPGTKLRSGINVIRYADDFIITGKTRELLEQRVRPAVVAFLAERGLTLSEEKTRITRIEEGFDFLGQRVRKYPTGKYNSRPTRKSLEALQDAVRGTLKEHRGDDAWPMIGRLNQTIRGWCNYHRHANSYPIFTWFDNWMFGELRRWLHRRHPNKGRWWTMGKYFRRQGTRRWTFHAIRKLPDGTKEIRDLLVAGRTCLSRHVKIQAEANPYDSAWKDYFANRKAKLYYFNPTRRLAEECG